MQSSVVCSSATKTTNVSDLDQLRTSLLTISVPSWNCCWFGPITRFWPQPATWRYSLPYANQNHWTMLHPMFLVCVLGTIDMKATCSVAPVGSMSCSRFFCHTDAVLLYCTVCKIFRRGLEPGMSKTRGWRFLLYTSRKESKCWIKLNYNFVNEVKMLRA